MNELINLENIEEVTCGFQFLIDFWEQHYLNYIREGGSKIKFITGKTGSGKTHFLDCFIKRSQNLNFIYAKLSAKNFLVSNIAKLYIDIYSQIDFELIVKAIGQKIITDLGYDYTKILANSTFADYLSEIGEYDVFTKKIIITTLKEQLLKNPYLEKNFAIAITFLVNDYLGLPLLEASDKETILQWLSGNDKIKKSTLRNVGLLTYNITKFNARYMIKSLSELIRYAGFGGLIVTIDDLDVFISNSSLNEVNYTKTKRDDAYELIRELIDQVDMHRFIMFVFSFDTELIENEVLGLKTYQALWMRIQNEVVSDSFNKFIDIVDLDKMMKKCFSVKTVLEMSQKYASLYGTTAFDEKVAEKLLNRFEYSANSLPQQIIDATIGGNKENE